MRILKAFISVFLLTIFVGGYTFAADSKNKTVEKQRPEYFNGVRIIYGNKEPEKIPRHIALEQFLRLIGNWGFDFARDIFANQMQIGELKADWFLALSAHVENETIKIKNESDICRYIHNLKKPRNKVTQRDITDFHNTLKHQLDRLILTADSEIQQNLTSKELAGFNRYLEQNIIPNTWYIPTSSSTVQKKRENSPSVKYAYCFEKEEANSESSKEQEGIKI